MTIRKRIIFIFLILSIFLILLLVTMFAYIEIRNSQENYKQLSRQTANGLAFMPALVDAINSGDHIELQGIIDRVRLQAENPVVTVVARDGTYIIHPDSSKIGIHGERDRFAQTLLFGSYVTDNAEGTTGSAIMTIAPVYEEYRGGERIAGAVTVEYLREDINATIVARLFRLLFVASLGIAICIGGALFLARSIQEDTLGVEPSVIARMFREREAMLNAVREGIVVIDQNEAISMINPSAKSLLNPSTNERTLVKVLGLQQTLHTGEVSYDEERVHQGKVFITNRIPLFKDEQVVGAICSFRDKTDIKQLQETVAQMKGYADGLRAQTHEFQNKMYVLMGLLQLEQYEEALKVIQDETAENKQTIPKLRTIEDPGAQAILLGKMAKAAEKKVSLMIDEASRLRKTNISITDMAIILGNLLDNAIDAVFESEQKEVIVMITDIGNEIVIDVQDTGTGIVQDERNQLFMKGFSSKGDDRGYGLAHVYETVKKYGGEIEISLPTDGGTVFSLYLPKWKGEA